MNWTSVTLALALLLCGCTGTPHDGAHGGRHTVPGNGPRSRPLPAPAPAAGSPAAPSTHPPTSGARVRGDVAACRDGDCEVTVRSGTKIPLAAHFGMSPITVTVDGDEVEVRAHAADTDMNDSVTAPATVTLNDITVKVIDAHDDVATLRISH